MRTELNHHVSTEIGNTWVRTLSHYLLFKKPRTTVFSAANPYDSNHIVSFCWDTADNAVLQRLHDVLVAKVQEHGFAPFKEAAQLLCAQDTVKQTAGKVKLLWLLSAEVGAHVTMVA